ncbi:MAG TPA: PEGA domain-containing protein [Spirochaetia bacterium]|nr:PEGA domain-containing protein [Spirochaetia bacterium]
MSRSLKVLTFALFALLAVGTTYAQFMPKRIWTLTVVVNVPGAVIYVDNQQVPGNQTKVTGGPHNLKVIADGYLAFNRPVVVTGDQTFSVNLQPAPRLQPMGFPVSVNVNVPDAVVFVDGVQVQGTPIVVPGQHSIQVSADGYQDYSVSVNVTGPIALDVVLNPISYQLTVNSNVPNAMVVVNDIAKGRVPYSEYLPPDTYTVRVSARGFVDYVATVSLDRPLVIDASLQPVALPSTISFVVPQPFLDPDMRPGDPQSQVRIFIDGRLVNPRREMDRIPIQPGRHRIRIASGAFSVQLADMDIMPGTSYVLELGMDVKVRAMKARAY